MRPVEDARRSRGFGKSPASVLRIALSARAGTGSRAGNVNARFSDALSLRRSARARRGTDEFALVSFLSRRSSSAQGRDRACEESVGEAGGSRPPQSEGGVIPALIPERPPSRRWTNDEILGAIRAWVGEHGRPPAWEEWNATNFRPSASTVRRRFGSWRRGLRAAGVSSPAWVDDARGTYRWSDAEILDAVCVWVTEHGRPPTWKEWRYAAPSHPSADLVAFRFGSVGRAVECAGFDSSGVGYGRMWGRDEILAAIRRWDLETGKQPSYTDWDIEHPGYPTNKPVVRVFGSWSAAIRAAGYRPGCRWSKRRVVGAMLEHVMRTGAWPGPIDWACPDPDDQRPTVKQVRCLFGSWRQAQIVAGRRSVRRRRLTCRI